MMISVAPTMTKLLLLGVWALGADTIAEGDHATTLSVIVGGVVSVVVAAIPYVLGRFRRHDRQLDRLEVAVEYIHELREAWHRGDAEPPPIPRELRRRPTRRRHPDEVVVDDDTSEETGD